LAGAAGRVLERDDAGRRDCRQQEERAVRQVRLDDLGAVVGARGALGVDPVDAGRRRHLVTRECERADRSGARELFGRSEVVLKRLLHLGLGPAGVAEVVRRDEVRHGATSSATMTISVASPARTLTAYSAVSR